MTKYEYEQNNWDKLQHFPDCQCKLCIDHPSQAKLGIHVFPDKLYVVTCLYNPVRYRNRYANYWTFENMVEKSGAILYTVEIAFGDRHFEITDSNNPRHLQLRASDIQELWMKENSLNVLIERLPKDWNKVAWIDADVAFARPDWAQETLHLLEHYEFLQMFSQAVDLTINYETNQPIPGIVYGRTLKDYTLAGKIKEGYYYGMAKIGGERKWLYKHPGFAWAARRTALNKVGGLIDWAILGAGDFLMAHALFGEIEEGRTINTGYSENYKELCFGWQDRALRHIRKNVGYLPGTAFHYYHGKKEDRRYNTRWKLLVETKFDPIKDIKKDVQGLWQLQDDGTDRYIALRDGLRKYARMRYEDLNVGTLVP